MKKLNADQVIGGNAKVVRSINRSGILNIIRERQPIPRMVISKLTGLNKSTVSSIVNELLDQELIYEEPLQERNVGRCPIELRLKLGKHFIGAINIDSALTRFAVVDLDGSVLKKSWLKTEKDNPAEFIKTCAEHLMMMKKELQIRDLKGIGISIAGIVDTKDSNIVEAPNLGWKDVPIGVICRDCFPDRYEIKFENDAKASALAELWFGTGEIKAISDFVFVSVGIGIGTGIVVDRELLEGHTHAAGEFGHMTMFPRGEYCACGNYGCFEAYASDRATVQRYNRLVKNLPDQKPEDLLKNVLVKVEEKDPAAIQAVRETGYYLGLGISNIIKALDPEAIVIGGRIIKAWDIIYPEIMKVVKSHVFFSIKPEVKMLPSSLKVRPRLLGAATVALKEIFDDYRIIR